MTQEATLIDPISAATFPSAGGALAGNLTWTGTTFAGLVLNNLTTTQRNSIASPGAGSLIWNVTTGRVNNYTGSAWTDGWVRLAGDTMTGPLAIAGGTATASAPLWDITQTWNSAGVTFTGLRQNVTDTASATASMLIDLQVGGVTRFNVTKTGAVVAAASVSSSAGTGFYIGGRSRFTSAADGQLMLSNAGQSDFARLQLGGTTASFPAIKRNGVTVEARLADDSAFAAVQTLYDRFGAGSPEGVVTAPVGASYHRTDGGAGTSLYVKESGTGNTGWVAK